MVGGGNFTQRCEAVGAVRAGPRGSSTRRSRRSTPSGVRTKVIHNSRGMVETTRDGKQHRDRKEREETVSENTSGAAVLAAVVGVVLVIAGALA